MLTSSAFSGANACAILALPGRLSRKTRPPRLVQCVVTDRGDLPSAPDWSTLWPDAPARFTRANMYVRVGLYAVHRILRLACGERAPESHLGIVLSSTTNCRLTDLRYHARLVAVGPDLASRVDFVATVPSAPAGEASVLWGLKGPFLVLAEPMDVALDEAKSLIRWGRARELIALGLEVPADDAPSSFQAWYLQDAGTVDSSWREQ